CRCRRGRTSGHPAVGVEADEPAASKLPAEAVDQPSLERERKRAGERALGRRRVRARERLLRRHVRRDLDAGRGLLLPAEPARARRESDAQLRTRAAELEAREPELRQLRAAPCECAYVIEPARGALPVRVGEPAEPEKVLREPALPPGRSQAGTH